MWTKKILLLLMIVAHSQWCVAQSKDALEIRRIMAAQESAWNRFDLEGFMEGYWHSDSLKFIGSKRLTYGWQKTLDNYRSAVS